MSENNFRSHFWPFQIDTTGVNRPGAHVPWDTSWVFQLGCVGNVENMAKSRMPVRNLWKSEYIHIMLRYYFIGG